MWEIRNTTPVWPVDTAEIPVSAAAARPTQQGLLKRQHSRAVSFKDLSLAVDTSRYKRRAAEPQQGAKVTADDAISLFQRDDLCDSPKNVCERKTLVIILVGLPGRGKTYLCNKLKNYLNWLGHTTGHFNVGQYRRKQKGDNEVQDASFFDHNNKAGLEARNLAVHAAMEDMLDYLESGRGQVAIFDATNSTIERRQMLINAFHKRTQYIFMESICDNGSVLEANYRNKMLYSPDYTNMTTEEALADFRDRIRKYEEVYESIQDKSLHYIKLINMVTPHGRIELNRVNGYIPGKLVFFLMQVCKAGMTGVRRIWLTRHGESEYNVKGLIGGDSTLSPAGEEYSRRLPEQLVDRLPTWKALDEINAGTCDGFTYSEIKDRFPEDFKERTHDKLRYRYPRGESYLDVIQRLEPVIMEIERQKDSICIVSHQAVIRALYGYFMGIPQEEIPNVDVPLHTIIELTPMPDGTMREQHIHVPLSTEHVASHAHVMEAAQQAPHHQLLVSA